MLQSSESFQIEISSTISTSKLTSDPNTILKSLIEGNLNYSKKHSGEYTNLKNKQAPNITLLTCCDSRVPQNLFDIDGLNEIFVIKNIGNQFRNSEGSIKYPIMHLKTPMMIVLGILVAEP